MNPGIPPWKECEAEVDAVKCPQMLGPKSSGLIAVTVCISLQASAVIWHNANVCPWEIKLMLCCKHCSLSYKPVLGPCSDCLTQALRTESAELPVPPQVLQVTPALGNNREPTQVTMQFTRILLKQVHSAFINADLIQTYTNL